MVRTTIYLPERLKERIEAYAARHGSTEAAVIREAVETLLGNEPDDRSWVQELAGIGRSEAGGPVADRVDEALAETGFGTRHQ
ncbi:MAG TPA: CopG family transcriptional regulator [Actinomycetota bacterium]